MRFCLAIVGLSACASAPVEDTDTLPSWEGVTVTNPANAVWVLSRSADGVGVGEADDATLCPLDAQSVGGNGQAVVCVSDAAGHSFELTRSVLGDVPRLDGIDAVCPSSTTPVGWSGEAAVCASPIVGRVAVLTADAGEFEPGVPQPDCPDAWDLVGFVDNAAVCRTDGLGSVVAITRTVSGQTLQTAQAEDMCPVGLEWLGRNRRQVLCDWPGANTVVQLTRGLGDSAAVDQASCPPGWERFGGNESASVCGLPASLTVVYVSRVTDSGVRVGQTCPEGFERLGGLSQAAACVELAR